MNQLRIKNKQTQASHSKTTPIFVENMNYKKCSREICSANETVHLGPPAPSSSANLPDILYSLRFLMVVWLPEKRQQQGRRISVQVGCFLQPSSVYR
jgi:hypothetical protein